MANVRNEELCRLAVESSTYYDDLYLPEDKAESVYQKAVEFLHSSCTIYKYRPDGTLEKTAAGTGRFRPKR